MFQYVSSFAIFAAVSGSALTDEQMKSWDSYCTSTNGPTSYCKFWNDPPRCNGGDQDCGTGTVPSYPSTTPAPTTTPLPSTGTQIPACDDYCVSLNGATSHCKYWLEVPVCLGGNQSCEPATCSGYVSPSTPAAATTVAPTSSPGCNSYCQDVNSQVSYCKSWLPVPTCVGKDQGCAASFCDNYDGSLATTPNPTATTTAVPTPTYEKNCDAYCIDLNDQDSYCKYWMPQAVCRNGDQPCTQDVCSTYVSSSTTSGAASSAPVVTSPGASTTASSPAATTPAPTTGPVPATVASTTAAATSVATTSAVTSSSVAPASASSATSTTAVPTSAQASPLP